MPNTDTKPTWTAEELANLPQTEAVFDQPQLKFDRHTWQQEGYMVTDVCDPRRGDCLNVGIPIGTGKLLIKTKKGTYDIVDETDVSARSR